MLFLNVRERDRKTERDEGERGRESLLYHVIVNWTLPIYIILTDGKEQYNFSLRLRAA